MFVDTELDEGSEVGLTDTAYGVYISTGTVVLSHITPQTENNKGIYTVANHLSHYTIISMTIIILIKNNYY